MAWTVHLKESVIDDLRWFGKKDGQILLKEVEQRLPADPLTVTQNMKTLRPNPVAQRELRLLRKYGILFDVDEETEKRYDRSRWRDLIDRLIEYNPYFRKMLADRLKERTVSVKEARKRL